MKEVVMLLLLYKMGSWGIRTQQMEKYLGQQAHWGFSRLTTLSTNSGVLYALYRSDFSTSVLSS